MSCFQVSLLLILYPLSGSVIIKGLLTKFLYPCNDKDVMISFSNMNICNYSFSSGTCPGLPTVNRIILLCQLEPITFIASASAGSIALLSDTPAFLHHFLSMTNLSTPNEADSMSFHFWIPQNLACYVLKIVYKMSITILEDQRDFGEDLKTQR